MLKAAYQATATKPKGPPCSIATALSNLDPEDSDFLRELLADPDKPSSRISLALRAEGHEISQITVARHRRGECRCARSAA